MRSPLGFILVATGLPLLASLRTEAISAGGIDAIANDAFLADGVPFARNRLLN